MWPGRNCFVSQFIDAQRIVPSVSSPPFSPFRICIREGWPFFEESRLLRRANARTLLKRPRLKSEVHREYSEKESRYFVSYAREVLDSRGNWRGKGWNRRISVPLDAFCYETSSVSQLFLLHRGGYEGACLFLRDSFIQRLGLRSKEAMWLRWRKKVIESHAIARMEFLPGQGRKKGNEREIFRRRLLKLCLMLERNLFTFFFLSFLIINLIFISVSVIFSNKRVLSHFIDTKSSYKHSV